MEVSLARASWRKGQLPGFGCRRGRGPEPVARPEGRVLVFPPGRCAGTPEGTRGPGHVVMAGLGAQAVGGVRELQNHCHA